jgi:hypothetical protein
LSAAKRLAEKLGRRACAVATVLTLMLGSSAAGAAPRDNLLSDLSPSRSAGVRRAPALTDSVQATSGADWNTELTTILTGVRSFLEYDLGRVQPIHSIYLQADNNDAYVVSASSDGQRFHELWVAPTADGSGLRPRSVSGLSGSARYLRLSARGGDGSYALSELQVFSSTPRPFPPHLETRSAAATSVGVRNALLTFGLALAAFVVFAAAHLPWYLLLALALIPISAAVPLATTVGASFPLESREVSLLRAVVAAVALVALVRERVGRHRWAVHPRALNATLIVLAELSVAAFYNAGHPQFWNAKDMRPDFVHHADMRVYYPFAKYFDELGYDGVYQASVAAYVEDAPGASLDSLRRVEIRSLENHRLERVEDVAPEISGVSARFSRERWAEFKRDMSYFRETMGNGSYLATHSDHGANATPVWVALARPWLAHAPASERLLVLGGLLDPLLLSVMFAFVGTTFGLRAMLLSIIVFGATDLYMFGTNWGGATLRHDWIAYLGLGACALRKERWVLGGALLGLAVMIRAFPVVALAGVGSACVLHFVEKWRRTGRPPRLERHAVAHAPALSVLAGAAGCMLISIIVTGALFSFERWVDWWNKVSLLDSKIGTNDVSLRALVAFGADQIPSAALRARMPLYVVLLGCIGAIVAVVTKRVRTDQAALLALPLILVVFNPANYYSHFIALLPLLGSDDGKAGDRASRDAPMFPHLSISGPLLALCTAEYWTVLDPDFARHFQYETLFTFVALAWMYKNVVRTLWPELGREQAMKAPEPVSVAPMPIALGAPRAGSTTTS